MVSYDPFNTTCYEAQNQLKGHQIIGELRHNHLIEQMQSLKLKGHQIIGELRRYNDFV